MLKERQRVAVRPRNAHGMSVCQVSLWRGTCRFAADAAAVKQFVKLLIITN